MLENVIIAAFILSEFDFDHCRKTKLSVTYGSVAMYTVTCMRFHTRVLLTAMLLLNGSAVTNSFGNSYSYIILVNP